MTHKGGFSRVKPASGLDPSERDQAHFKNSMTPSPFQRNDQIVQLEEDNFNITTHRDTDDDEHTETVSEAHQAALDRHAEEIDAGPEEEDPEDEEAPWIRAREENRNDMTPYGCGFEDDEGCGLVECQGYHAAIPSDHGKWYHHEFHGWFRLIYPSRVRDQDAERERWMGRMRETRHALGARLRERGLVTRINDIYDSDEEYPNNAVGQLLAMEHYWRCVENYERLTANPPSPTTVHEQSDGEYEGLDDTVETLQREFNPFSEARRAMERDRIIAREESLREYERNHATPTAAPPPLRRSRRVRFRE